MTREDELEPLSVDGSEEGADVRDPGRRFTRPLLLVSVVATAAVVTSCSAAVLAVGARRAVDRDQRAVETRMNDLSVRIRQLTPARRDVIVPSVVGLTRREGTAILVVAGLQAPAGGDDARFPDSPILDQDPTAGTRVAPGTVVLLGTGGAPIADGAVEVTGSAAELAAAAACEDVVAANRQGESADAPRALTSVQCHIGDASIGIRTYPSEADVTDALAALAGCGHRTVGRNWIVAVDALESARLLQHRLGGRVVQLAGCESG